MSWKAERPLKYETMRPVSAAVSVKHRPPAVTRRKVQSAGLRRPQHNEFIISNRPDIAGDQVTGRRLTTTPDNSDVEDDGKNTRRVDAWRSKRSECADKCKDTKNSQIMRDRTRRRTVSWKTSGPQCAGGLDDGLHKTRLMEDNFKQQVLRLQQQLGVSAEGYVIPP